MRILFVCLGNICRSPIAEGIMKHLIKNKNLDWYIDSASTNTYHTGEPPHKTSQKVCLENNINISNQRARRISKADIKNFDILYVMANDVKEDVKYILGDHYDDKKVKLFLNELKEYSNKDVPDPWYGGEEGFYPVYDLIYKGCEAIIQKYTHE